MAPPTREEADRVIAEILRAWDSGVVGAVDQHLVSPIGDLEQYESMLGRPIRLEGVEFIDDRRSVVGLRSSMGGVLTFTMLRCRDGRLRIDMAVATGDPADANASFAALAEGERALALPLPERQGPGKRRRWRGAPKKLPRIGDIPYLGLGRVGTSAEEVAALEREIGRVLPEGYGPYVVRFGEALDSAFVRVYPPERIRTERVHWRQRIDAYWLWEAAEDGFDQDAAYDSYVLADTVTGDELLWNPGRPGLFYVLPRNDDIVIRRAMSFEALLAWAASSGDLGPRSSLRYVAPLRDRISVPLSYEEIEPVPLANDLAALADGATCSHEPDGTTLVLWTTRGVELLASEEPYVGLTHEPTSDASFIDDILGVLAKHGIVRAEE